eukprot:1330558-Rhodomonas_salina.1
MHVRVQQQRPSGREGSGRAVVMALAQSRGVGGAEGGSGGGWGQWVDDSTALDTESRLLVYSPLLSLSRPLPVSPRMPRLPLRSRRISAVSLPYLCRISPRAC